MPTQMTAAIEAKAGRSSGSSRTATYHEISAAAAVCSTAGRCGSTRRRAPEAAERGPGTGLRSSALAARNTQITVHAPQPGLSISDRRSVVAQRVDELVLAHLRASLDADLAGALLEVVL